MLFTSEVSNAYCMFPNDLLTHTNSEHEPLPRLDKASSFCLSFECGMTPVSLLWACWLFPQIRRWDWHFLRLKYGKHILLGK